MNEAGFTKTADYIVKKNEDVMLLLNIESTHAVKNLETLLSYDGVDGVFIGPHDLRLESKLYILLVYIFNNVLLLKSVSMDCPEEWDNEEYQATISHIIKTTRQCGKSIGVHWSFTDSTKRQIDWMKQGANMVMHSADIKLFHNSLKADMGVLKEHANRIDATDDIDHI